MMSMMMYNSKSSSVKTLCSVLGLILIIVIAQLNEADCRALRSMENTTTTTTAIAGCDQQNEGGEMMAGMASFAVSSNNSSSSSNRPSARSLAFRLASGPSKKGPGH
ncbi:hypothetical protein F8388_018759 [Cannabis sativa]|uniref:Uncharacterized protein n=1 Tax=Cannabis sativa TaxID=3483 RepID=A0A7J6GMA6_CANSA|nr:hypothetical protein F8388_018759 [Cannabis sativa]